jgi:hypothetical protein
MKLTANTVETVSAVLRKPLLSILLAASLVAGEADRVKETDKTETLVPWLYDGVLWQYADGREVRHPGYEDIIAGALR